MLHRVEAEIYLEFVGIKAVEYPKAEMAMKSTSGIASIVITAKL
jgi:hypothetical protein